MTVHRIPQEVYFYIYTGRRFLWRKWQPALLKKRVCNIAQCKYSMSWLCYLN